MTKLEILQHAYSEVFTINETAGISQLYVSQKEPLNPYLFLDAHYKGELTV